MREILFRGKTEKGEWVYGNYCGAEYLTIIEMQHIIIEAPRNGRSAKVDPETVGQYTGLRDCKRTEQYPEGQRIFEGDIVKDPIGTFVVKFLDGMFCASLIEAEYLTNLASIVHYCEIIGNIYDNPELLKGSEAVK